jgi:MerR family mercuric resistance operon transcriptional regulator
MDSELSIGRLAADASVNVETIRYYQRRGLLAVPEKPHNGHRRYPSAAVKRVRFIKRAQLLGFTLDEVSVLLELDEAQACSTTLELAERKLELIERKMTDLRAMRAALSKLTRACGSSGMSKACPIIHALAAD